MKREMAEAGKFERIRPAELDQCLKYRINLQDDLSIWFATRWVKKCFSSSRRLGGTEVIVVAYKYGADVSNI